MNPFGEASETTVGELTAELDLLADQQSSNPDGLAALHALYERISTEAKAVGGRDILLNDDAFHAVVLPPDIAGQILNEIAQLNLFVEQ